MKSKIKQLSISPTIAKNVIFYKMSKKKVLTVSKNYKSKFYIFLKLIARFFQYNILNQKFIIFIILEIKMND